MSLSAAGSIDAGTGQSGPVFGPCSLGAKCSAKNQELLDQYRCRNCNRQLHGFISGCSQARNPKDFRDGVICTVQPCFIMDQSKEDSSKPDGVAAGLPKFLWETQQPKRKRDPNAPKLRRQRYTKEQKESVLATLHNTPGTKLPDIAKQFNIPEGTLRGWYDEERKAKAAAMAGIGDQMGGATMEINKNAGIEMEGAPKKKRRQRYSNETKIQVILALETRPNVSLNDVAREFNVAAGTVRGWREEADKIQKQAMENRRVGAKANPSRDPLRRIWDAILNLFERNSRLPVAQRLEVNVAVVRTIGKQARDILLQGHQESPFLTETEVNSMEKFKASETWARKWARDHQVISTKEELISPHANGASAMLIDIQKIVAAYPPENVYTMASLGLFYRVLPHRTYVSRVGQRRVRACKGLKCKDRISLYICTNETGTDKIPITCIGKYENPSCFRVAAQRKLPYLHQKQTLSDAGTFQMWWRTVFLPHVRSRFRNGEKVLLLVETLGPCKAELLKDPTDQVRVEALPPSMSSTLTYANANPTEGKTSATQQPTLPQCQPLEHGILETIKRRYRYRLLVEVMASFEERAQRRKVARDASFPAASSGLREGSLANICDAMRLLDSIWKEVATTTITKSWQRTKLRPAALKDPSVAVAGQRVKSEKRQTTREKKQVVKALNDFLKKHESKDFAKEEGANQLEEMIEKLKNCFLYTDGEVIETKEMVESLEEWVGLEDSFGMISLFMEEIKEELNIEYLVGLKDPVEGVVPDADEPDDPHLEPEIVAKNEKPDEELRVATAMELATKIKATACTLFNHGNILGDLAVSLDEASDSIFRLLRKQQEAAVAKVEAEEAKAIAKAKAASRKAASQKAKESEESTNPTSAPATEQVNHDEAKSGVPHDMAQDAAVHLDGEGRGVVGATHTHIPQEPSHDGPVDGNVGNTHQVIDVGAGVSGDAAPLVGEAIVPPANQEVAPADVGEVHVGDVVGDVVDISDLAEFGEAQMELTDV